MAEIYTYGYETDAPVGDKSMKASLGGKGANLGEMFRLGMKVPPGITIPTDYCKQYLGLTGADKMAFVEHFMTDMVFPELNKITEQWGQLPLWSVRSGAEHSMPGMMNTLLNIGLTTYNMSAYEQQLGWQAAHDCRRRQFEMWADVVLDWDITDLQNTVANSKYGTKQAPGTIEAAYESVPHLVKLIEKYEADLTMPDDPDAQLVQAVCKVFESWMTPRAIEYRKLHKLDDTAGTAVNIQAMVFGNLNNRSCSGVVFTRDPQTGNPLPYGEFKKLVQGEDVVAGKVAGTSINELAAFDADVNDELAMNMTTLEAEFADMMDIEFTVENGNLWMLQCRVGKREATAAFRIARDFAESGLITKKEALTRVTSEQYYALKKTRIDLPADEIPEPDFTGYAAGGGLVVGRPVYSKEEAEQADDDVILVRDETTPDDFSGMIASVGILTRNGGITSHAAVVARSFEKHCVVGVLDLPQDLGTDRITIDGSTGRVWMHELPLMTKGVDEAAETLMSWAREGKVLKVSPESHMLDGNCVVLGDLGVETVLYKLTAISDALKAGEIEIDRVFIDVTVPGSDTLDEDADLWSLGGYEINPALERLDARVKGLMLDPTLDPLKQVAVLVGPAGALWSLSDSGWTVCKEITTLDALLDAEGVVDVKLPESDATTGKLIEKLSKAGQVIEQVPAVFSLNKLVHEALG